MEAWPPTPRVFGLTDFNEADSPALMDVAQLMMAISTMPSPDFARVDAIGVFVGLGEEYRLRHAISLFESEPALRLLLVANGNPAERTYVPITMDYLNSLGLRRREGVHIQLEPAPNTGLQAAWMVDMVNSDLHIENVALTVSPFHLFRAYLTVLAALESRGARIPVVPVPAPIPPHLQIPETGADGYDMLTGEIFRILSYARQGWIASSVVARQHLTWMWTEHPDLVGADARAFG